MLGLYRDDGKENKNCKTVSLRLSKLIRLKAFRMMESREFGTLCR